jgi:hypothetical protein
MEVERTPTRNATFDIRHALRTDLQPGQINGHIATRMQEVIRQAMEFTYDTNEVTVRHTNNYHCPATPTEREESTKFRYEVSTSGPLKTILENTGLPITLETTGLPIMAHMGTNLEKYEFFYDGETSTLRDSGSGLKIKIEIYDTISNYLLSIPSSMSPLLIGNNRN